MDAKQLSIRFISSLIAGFTALIVFCLYIDNIIPANADAIFPFSFCLDIIQHLPIHTWMFPVPTFIFPDILISLPFVYFIRDPLLWFNVSSILQPLCLILLTCFYLSSVKPKLAFFAPITYLMVLLYAIGWFLSPPNWHFYPSLVLLVHHMFTAIFAMFFYLWTTPEKLTRLHFRSFIPACLLFYLGSYSDLFFFIYYFAFIFATVLMYRFKIFSYATWIKGISIYFISGLLGALTNNFTNHKILKQFQQTNQTLSFYERLQHFISMVHIEGMLLFIGFPFLFLILYSLYAKNLEQRKIVISLLLGYFFILTGLIFAGLLNADIATLRYTVIYFPIIVFISAYLLPRSLLSYFTAIPVSACITTFALGIAYVNWNTNMGISYPANSQTILSCNDFQKYSKNATVIASYWYAKILFEGAHRSFNLIQASNKLTFYRWIDNTKWREKLAFSPAITNNHFLFVMDGLTVTAQVQVRALPYAKSLCEGKVILAPTNVEQLIWKW